MGRVFHVVRPVATVWFRVEPYPEPAREFGPVANTNLYPSGSGIVIEEWGNITAIRSTISIRLLLAAPNISGFLAGVWQTGDCSIHN